MANSTKKYPISYDIIAGDTFILKKTNEQLIFNWSPSGLYLHNSRGRNILMVTTMKENREGYTIRDIEKTTEALAGLSTVGNTSSGDYIEILRSRLTPITPEAFTIANTIFGP